MRPPDSPLLLPSDAEPGLGPSCGAGGEALRAGQAEERRPTEAEGGRCPSRGVTHLQGLERGTRANPHPRGAQTPKAGEAANLPGQETKAATRSQQPSPEHVTAAVTLLPALHPGSPPCRGESSVLCPRGRGPGHCAKCQQILCVALRVASAVESLPGNPAWESDVQTTGPQPVHSTVPPAPCPPPDWDQPHATVQRQNQVPGAQGEGGRHGPPGVRKHQNLRSLEARGRSLRKRTGAFANEQGPTGA